MIQPGEDGGFAQELFAGFTQHLRGERAVVLHFLEGALAAFQAHIVRQVDGTHPTLADDAADAITAA